MRELVPKRNSLGAGGNRANQWKQALRSFITCSWVSHRVGFAPCFPTEMNSSSASRPSFDLECLPFSSAF